MMSSIQSMLEHYQPKTAEAYRNALELELWNPAFFQAITENLTASTPMEQKRTR